MSPQILLFYVTKHNIKTLVKNYIFYFFLLLKRIIYWWWCKAHIPLLHRLLMHLLHQNHIKVKKCWERNSEGQKVNSSAKLLLLQSNKKSTFFLQLLSLSLFYQLQTRGKPVFLLLIWQIIFYYLILLICYFAVNA